MTPNLTVTRETVLVRLLDSIAKAAEFNGQDQVAPAIILWTDKDRQWEPLTPKLRAALPHFIALGPYDPGQRAGPGIWIKCMLERTLPGATWSPEVVPVLYLPGVSRHELRAVEDCPRELQPLAELQYRGVWFTQESTKDWTVAAFLSSGRGGLGLDVAADGATREAILNALTKLADTSVAELRGHRLHAADFQALLQPDLVRQLLRWLDAPVATRDSWTSEEWHSFCAACRERYDFDPVKDGELVGAEKLGARDGNWDPVWHRFLEAPEAYPNLPELLRRAKPRDDGPSLFFHRECWPQCNETEEDSLRGALDRLESLAPESAAGEIAKLEASHGLRRSWVWAKLGRAPLAQALEHLALLARATRTKLGGETATAMATMYESGAWRADAAALEALAGVTKAADVAAIKVALQAVYKPWLEAGAERFQDRVREKPEEAYGTQPKEVMGIGPGTCIVFADGLRLDLGKRLRAALEEDGLLVEDSWRWVPLPPVTPTAKPVASPVADLVTGEADGGEQFQPSVRESGQPLTVERFRKLLGHQGVQDLRGDDTGDPTRQGWAEYGEIDRRGHEEGWKLARRIAEEIAGLVDRIRALLDAGWREVRVVTDHGWLLVPGGLPKVEMPQYLVESRWTRCGTLKPGSKVELQTAPWHWNRDVQIVLAPGIGSFRAGTEYSHGSLSVQECVVLNLVVRPAQPSVPAARLESVRWTGLRCHVHIVGAGAGASVDLRTKVSDPSSSLALNRQPRAIDTDGIATILVDNPDCEGTAAMVVLLNEEGRVSVKVSTTVGGEE